MRADRVVLSASETSARPRGVEQRLRPEPCGQLREVGVARRDQRVVHVERSVRMRIEHVVANRPPQPGTRAPTRPSGSRLQVNV